VQREQRKLAAVLAADVVGYSRLMGRDEAGTLARLKEHRAQRLQPALASYAGRLVKLTGDGALAEFPSAVGALRAAIEFQQAVDQANAALPEEHRIVFRVGLHLGDLIVDGDDLYGDGVNVAARLEAEAAPGGIVVSGAFHEAVGGKLQAGFVDLGRLSLKNIDRAVQAYRVEWKGAGQQSPSGPSTAAPLPLPDKPSIAVLPFQNMSGDPEQEYFADGMVEDIITALSRTKQLFVIARNSSFVFKGKAVDIRDIGRTLGVRYLLEGSVRKAGSQLRITGQLIEAETGNHVWADRFDGALDQLFDLQDQISTHVVSAILPSVERQEIARSRRRPAASLQAYDHYLRGRAKWVEYTDAANDEAIACFRKAVELDSDLAVALACSAQCIKRRVDFGWSRNVAQDFADAAVDARKALALDDQDPVVLANAGSVLAMLPQHRDEGAALMDRAVSLDPNNFNAWNWGGWVCLMRGDGRAAHHFEQALRLSPTHPGRYWLHVGMAATKMTAGQYSEAADQAALVLRHQPRQHLTLWIYTASLALAGRLEEAREGCRRMLEVNPDRRLSNAPEWLVTTHKPTLDILLQGLRLAGLPE
jgi:TolB-like protein/class 3 adenylate cyclase/Tfp pilus assembly protein PilF